MCEAMTLFENNEDVNRPRCSKNLNQNITVKYSYNTKSCLPHLLNPSTTLFGQKARASRSARKKLIRTEHATQFGKSNDCSGGSNDTDRATSQPAGTPILQFDHFYETPSARATDEDARSQKRGGCPAALQAVSRSPLSCLLSSKLRYTAT
jgi:hypothetical protein